jgi:hypothetical protein
VILGLSAFEGQLRKARATMTNKVERKMHRLGAEGLSVSAIRMSNRIRRHNHLSDDLPHGAEISALDHEISGFVDRLRELVSTVPSIAPPTALEAILEELVSVSNMLLVRGRLVSQMGRATGDIPGQADLHRIKRESKRALDGVRALSDALLPAVIEAVEREDQLLGVTEARQEAREEHAEAARAEFEKTGSTKRRCLQCGGKFRFTIAGSSYRIACENGDFQLSSRGI